MQTKVTIKGKEYVTFPENKTAKELGIDLSRKFIFCESGSDYKDGFFGTVWEVEKDSRNDLNRSAYYMFNMERGLRDVWSLSRMAYYDKQSHPLTNTIITDIKSEEQHKQVQEKLFGMGLCWLAGERDIHNYGAKFLYIKGDNRFGWRSNINEINTPEFLGFTIIPASEFLMTERGEDVEEKPEMTEDDPSFVYWDIINHGTAFTRPKEFQRNFINELNNYKYPTPSPRTGDGIKRMLKTLSSTLKRVLSPALQSQYRAGYINGALELTDLGVAELLRLVAKDKEVELAASADEFIAEQEKESKK